MWNIFSVIMRIITTLIGLLMLFMGSIWIMQGTHIGPAAVMRGFMVNDPHWTVYGAILALVGIGEVVWANMRQRRG